MIRVFKSKNGLAMLRNNEMEENSAPVVVFNHDHLGLPIGQVRFAPEEMSKLGQHVYEHIQDYIFVPDYIEHEDGRVELLALSAIINPNRTPQQ
jgi:hypothetical protein